VIRDSSVTGVQTCALPILTFNAQGNVDRIIDAAQAESTGGLCVERHVVGCLVAEDQARRGAIRVRRTRNPAGRGGGGEYAVEIRSEERRVGEGERGRWAVV